MGSETSPALDEMAEAAVFHRKIEFHVARKQYNGFCTNSNNGFKLITLNPNSSEPHKASGSVKKSERLEFPENAIDPELSFRITFRRIGAGLRNLGNTCFLNSVLQCLTYTEPLAAYLQSGKHQNSCRTAGFCALCAIQKHVSRALQSTGRILEPKDLVSNLRCISRNFRNARQEDAHEYMVNLLESMHKCCLPTGVPSESPSAYEKSLVHKIFGGRLRSQVKCMQCSFCSNKFDPFLDLSLEIMKADSLYKALAHFTAKEQLDGGAKQYQCQQCKQKVRALKQLTIYKAPRVLAIHLKRFGSHQPGQKIDKNVSFGPMLDLKPYVTGPYDGDLKYTLYGVLVHAGWSTHSGHYYCFVRTSSGMWYSLDDNQVVQVSEKKVLAQKAYMLFYVRDGGNISSKKPVDIGHKEDMVLNAIGNASYSKLNQELKVKIQNGMVDKTLDVPVSAAASSAKNAPNTNASKEIPSDNVPSPNMIGNESIKSVQLKTNPQLEPPIGAPPAKDIKECLTATTTSVDHQLESSSSKEASGDAPSLGEAAQIVECSKQFSDAKDINASASILPVSCEKGSCDVAMPSSHNTDSANKMQCESAAQPPNSIVLSSSSVEKSNKDGTHSEVCDGRTMPMGTIEQPSDKFGCKSEESCSIKERLSSGMTESKRPLLKTKKELFKYQFASMQLCSNIIFSSAFGLQKKHKRRKCRSLQKKSSNLLPLENDMADLGPSPSGNSLPVSTEYGTPSGKKKRKCGSDDDDKTSSAQNGNGVSADVTKNELRQRVGANGTVLSGEKASNTIKSVDVGPGNSEEKRESVQAGMLSLLTRGLEETTVARWDGINVSLPEKPKRTLKNVQIGYIGDEWDEEYDRGKRKKLRSSKISFGGPNLFQEVASGKHGKRKRPKLN